MTVNTNTIQNSTTLEVALAGISASFRGRIISAYLESKSRFDKAHFDCSFDATGLSVSKYCEAVLRFLQQELTGTHAPFGKRIKNFVDEANKLSRVPDTTGNESLRVIIPRALVFVYTIRNKRGIGHTGGDVEANAIDAATIMRMSDWIICELIRIYHNLSIEEAQAVVDALSTRSLPLIWEVGGKKRVLEQGLDYKQKVLALAYSEPQSGVMVEDLFAWTEYSNLAVFRKSVLLPLHQARLIEYDQESHLVFLSPLGVQEVEEHLLSQPVRGQAQSSASRAKPPKRG